MVNYKAVRVVLSDILRDREWHSTDEIMRICRERGVLREDTKGPIYNVVYRLKKGEILDADGKGNYKIKEGKEFIEKDENDFERQHCNKINFEEFEVVKPLARKKLKQVISIFENGDFAINNELRKEANSSKFEVRIKPDCTQILLLLNGKEITDVGKNNRIKNYGILEKLKRGKIKLPAYYVGNWDNKNNCWIGDLSTENPNVSKKNISD